MIKFNRPLYYCSECKTVVASLDRLLFIEPNTSKGFCSESCIEDFYSPLMTHFESLEKSVRQHLSISDEVIHSGMDDKTLIEAVFKSPSEVWRIANELGESIYTYIRHFDDFSAVVIAAVYNEEASFVFFRTLTRSKAFLNEFRPEETEKKSAPSSEQSDLSEEDFAFLQELEVKKSRLLADLLTNRKDDDVPFEEFPQYESCFQDCLEMPDEVFETKDKEGDVFFVYIKSFMQEGNNFFYIVSCLKRKDTETAEDVSVFPVLAFPTTDMDLVQEFRSGHKVSGHLSN